MRILANAGLAAAVVLLALQPAFAASSKLTKGPPTLPQQERAAPEGRAVQVVLDTPQIGTQVEIGRVIPDTSAGSKIAALTSMAQREADVAIAPLRSALEGYDGNSKALDAAKAGLMSVSWLNPVPLETATQPGATQPLDFIAIAKTPTVGLVRIGYYLSPDATRIEARADLEIVRKSGKGGAITVLVLQHITSAVLLDKPSFVVRENIARWSAQNGLLARSAIDRSLGQLRDLIPRSFNLDASQIAAFSTATDMAQAAGRFGPVIERGTAGPGSVVIWSKGLIGVMPASN
ncbi:hypothetical protein [Novosphingobium taihuense]|uniref:Uncharacterized protein n=1 Tax=Novosphingobium taihuense TaxID=260085 RepID=A0A7W7A7Y0_9SPHN|nr:hypothetical protein [Novosphingobium taihuense]MBB4612084.1 hypothetical protein [Novosphingobium taihuense]TWH88563.1 hypothetical protein IQ25_00686 [Novosphingobium taihuense]